MRALRSRFTFGNVMAVIALFVAIGTGTAFALDIDSGDVANNSLKSKDLKNGKAVTTEDVQDGTLLCQDFQQDQGACQVTNVTVRSGSPFVATTVTTNSVTATCETGERAVGGGYSQGPGSSVIVLDDRPDPASGTPTGWTVRAEFDPGDSLNVFAVCAA